ncbi:MAG: hypothetical protein JO283_17160 [Bradyrhizobium sp.]|nr:hypothetical protein [Bradyrhizobium sp.]
MKVILLGVVLGLGSIAPSLAADLPESPYSAPVSVTTASGAVLGSVSPTRWGGTAGTGVEYGFTPNWSAAFEYDRLFRGSNNVTYVGPAGILFENRQLTRDVNLLTVRVNYKFGGPGFGMF